MKYWQVATGSMGRDYTKECLKFGMAFVGGDGNVETMKEVKSGDCIILKQGKSTIAAVGRVVERNGICTGVDDKEWLRDFDGWDLRAYCMVEWHELSRLKEVSGLTRGTIQRVRKPHLQRIANEILQLPSRKEVCPEPSTTECLKDDEILTFLIREGLRPAVAEDLTITFGRIRRLAQYYYDECESSDIREHETRTFLIIPLLLALGWAEQQIKIELSIPSYGKIDVACFSKPYRRDSGGRANNGDCVLVLESKGFRSGLDFASKQAKDYAKHFPSSRTVVVSNGYCYKTYDRESGGKFSTTPSAYLNLLQPRERYPLDPKYVGGALQVLKSLLPQSWR